LYADLSLIRDYKPQDDLVWRPVVVTHFQKDEKNLYYINARHVAGIHNPTCDTVREAINRYKPQLVIIEGFPTEAGSSPDFYIDYANRDAARGFVSGEPAYTAFLAHQSHIPFVGGEPSHAALVASLEREGYSVKDIMAFYLLRMISQERREGNPMDEAHFAESAAHYLQQDFSYIPQQERLTTDEFEAWYDAHKADAKHFLKTSTDDTAPYASPAGSYFQHLNHRLGMVREEHLDGLIAKSLTSNDRILVIYGDAHLVRSRAVFEKMLAPGTSTQIAINQGEKQSPSRPVTTSAGQSDMASPL
jgi:hypothetical protein